MIGKSLKVKTILLLFPQRRSVQLKDVLGLHSSNFYMRRKRDDSYILILKTVFMVFFKFSADLSIETVTVTYLCSILQHRYSYSYTILGEFKIPGIFVLGITQASFISHISSTAPNCESCAHTDLASS